MKPAKAIFGMLEMIKRRETQPDEPVRIAVFGKHPGWDDHIDDIGLRTDVLTSVKRILYVEGIGGNIESGSWEKYAEKRQIEEFGHAFVWRMKDSLVAGRLWASEDGKGRRSYPMVACAQCSGLSLEWALEHGWTELERLRVLCTATRQAQAVRSAVGECQAKLQQSAISDGGGPGGKVATLEALRGLAGLFRDHQDTEGLLRILYHIERYVPEMGKDGDAEPRPTLLRVPMWPQAGRDTISWWMGLLGSRAGREPMVCVLAPQSRDWMDLIVGPPGVSELMCLRASPEATPLTSRIPYTMDSDFRDRTNRLLEEARSS
jgi:hypothetical protein